MSTVLIRQIPDDYSEAVGLSKYNRSRMPGCKDRFSVAINHDGRFLTNLDEDAYNVKEEDRERIKNLRLKLEKKLGKDLSGVSEYWKTFQIVIDADKPKVFNTENPLDELSLYVGIANKIIAPSKEEAFMHEYREAQYYAYTEETEAQEEMVTRKKRDKAIAELHKIGENKDRLLLYGQYLEGLKYQESFSVDILYKMLRAYIDEKNIDNTNKFLAIISIPVEEIIQKILIDKALKQKIIKKVSLGNKKTVYQFGQVTIGSTVEELYKNLSSVEFAPELMNIKIELERK